MADDAAPVHDVAIVGAGPVGLASALGLARLGVRSILIEQRHAPNEQSRAPVIQARTLEILRHWGVAERFVECGTFRPTVSVHTTSSGGARPAFSVDFAEIAELVADPGVLVIEQGKTERLLLDALERSGLCDIRLGCELVELRTGAEQQILTIDDGARRETIAARFVVGADGAGSSVRKAIGLPFPGRRYRLEPILADVRIGDERDRLPWPRVQNDRRGLGVALRLSEGLWRVFFFTRAIGAGSASSGTVDPAELDRRVGALLGDGPAELLWSSRFSIHLRSAPRFRRGRILLAGDAAHIHSPAGAQGMNSGIQDAHDLSWKLAAVLTGADEERLLDAYDAERRPIAAGRVARFADTMTRVLVDVPRPVRALVLAAAGVVFAVPPPRRSMMRRFGMLDARYRGSPILTPGDHASGRRLPDVLLHASGAEERRLHASLPPGFVLLSIGQPPRLPSEAASMVPLYALPADVRREAVAILRRSLGSTDAWVLVRPDRHIAWARRDTAGIVAAIDHARGRGVTPPGRGRRSRPARPRRAGSS